MRLEISEKGFGLRLSDVETADWARGGGPNPSSGEWPCSESAWNSLFVSFDANGLCDLELLDGDSGEELVMEDPNELGAIVADHVDLPEDHPCEIYLRDWRVKEED